MLFSPYLSNASLANLCRMLRHSLGAGIGIVEVFRQQSKRGSAGVPPLAARVTAQLEQGNTLISALRAERTLPPLFLSLVEMAEESGHLSEVFGTLEEYYTLQQQTQRRFRSEIFLPVMQFVLAALVVALLIWLLGMIARSRGGGPGGVLGLSGESGAILFLVIVFGGVLLLVVGGQLLLQQLRGKYALDSFLLRVPLVGNCTRSLAMARFTLALHLTLEAGMLITRAIRLSLQVTGNAAFAAVSPRIEKQLRAGESLTEAMTGVRVFPEEFVHILAVAEESGRLPESMHQQCRYYQEESERQLKALMKAAAWGIWLLYAIFVIVMISQVAGVYFGALPQ